MDPIILWAVAAVVGLATTIAVTIALRESDRQLREALYQLDQVRRQRTHLEGVLDIEQAARQRACDRACDCERETRRAEARAERLAQVIADAIRTGACVHATATVERGRWICDGCGVPLRECERCEAPLDALGHCACDEHGGHKDRGYPERFGSLPPEGGQAGGAGCGEEERQ